MKIILPETEKYMSIQCVDKEMVVNFSMNIPLKRYSSREWVTIIKLFFKSFKVDKSGRENTSNMLNMK